VAEAVAIENTKLANGEKARMGVVDVTAVFPGFCRGVTVRINNLEPV
jgi:hypothetical protein